MRLEQARLLWIFFLPVVEKLASDELRSTCTFSDNVCEVNDEFWWFARGGISMFSCVKRIVRSSVTVKRVDRKRESI